MTTTTKTKPGPTVAPKGLDSRFTLAGTTRTFRTIARIVGEHGTGKTRLGLTGPGPVMIFSFDRGTEGVVEEFRASGKAIYDQEYDWDPGKILDGSGQVDAAAAQKQAQDLRDRLEADLAFALDNGVRTLIFDKETDIWQLYRYAEFGGPSEKPKDYQALNLRYLAMLNMVKSYPVNAFYIQAMKDEWGTKKVQQRDGSMKETPGQTGQRIPWGFDRLSEMVMVEIACRRVGSEFFFDFRAPWDPAFGKCRQNASLCGQSFPAMTLPELGTLLIEGSSEEDWSR